MPKLDGFAVLRRIREESKVPAIMCTARVRTMIKFYIEEGTLYRNKERIILTKTEFLILKLLMFLSIVIFISCLMIVSFGIGEDGSPGGNVYEIMDSNGNIINIKSITRLGGWIEKLDEDYNIIESWGEKKTS